MNNIYEYEKSKIKDLLGDNDYKLMQENNVFLCGGAILSIFNNDVPNDFDLYFKNKEDMYNVMTKASINTIVSFTKRSMIVANNDVMYNYVFFDYFNNVQEIFESFDFTVVMAGYDFSTEEFIFDPRFHRDIIGNRLIYSTTNKYPIGTALRIQKYENKGFSISRKEMIKIMLKVSSLNFKNIEEVEDHIQGMYGLNLKDKWEEYNKEFNMENVISFISALQLDFNFNNKNSFISTIENVDEYLWENIDEILNNTEQKDIQKMEHSYNNDIKEIATKYFNLFNWNLNIIKYISSNEKLNNMKTSFINGDSYSYSAELNEEWNQLALNKNNVTYKYEEVTLGDEDEITIYKTVNKKNDKYFSNYDSKFEYTENTFATPSNPDSYGNGIYTTMYKEDSWTNYLKLKGKIKNIKDMNGLYHIVFSKVFVEKCY